MRNGNVVELMERIFLEAGWEVARTEAINGIGVSVDFAAENESAIVFCAAMRFRELSVEARRLTSEVAAVLQARSAGSKTWEGYLLLLCSGDARQFERIAHDVQHDLSYCRKLVVAVDAISPSADLRAVLREKVSFLFPLRTDMALTLADVSSAFVGRLVANGVDRSLAEALHSHFDESKCNCLARLRHHLEPEVD